MYFKRKPNLMHQYFFRFSLIVFYDHDGTLAANVLSPLRHVSDLFASAKVIIL